MNTTTLQLKSINFTKVGLVTAALVLALGIAIDYVSVAMAESNTIELVTSSISGGGGEMSGGAVSLESSVGQSEPVGSSSSASFSLESGFIPVIAEQYSLNGDPPATTPTPIPNIWDAPSTSGWGLAALVAGMLVVLVIALRLTSGSRRATRP
jgi:hypothetical protein